MRTSPYTCIAIAAVLGFGLAMPASAGINVDISTVGNPGNAADPSGYGSVGYTFGIGTYDVTLDQYTAFLNAVAATDTYGLYNTNLATNTDVAGIARSGDSGSYTYSVIGDGQRPVTYVSWFDAARFTNWLSNGQPAGAEGTATTETGAYTLLGDMTTGLETKTAGSAYWIPSVDEWFKAAYYDPSLNSGAGDYWSFATRSNDAPGNSWADRTLPNMANFYSGGYTMTDPTGTLSPVGAFTNSASAYGTYDQSGEVWNWNDAIVAGVYRDLRGGSWTDHTYFLQSSSDNYDSPTYEGPNVGFRVAAEVPEPTSIMLMGLGGLLLLSIRRRQSN